MVPQSPIKNPMVSECSIFSGDGIHWGGCPDSRVRSSPGVRESQDDDDDDD